MPLQWQVWSLMPLQQQAWYIRSHPVQLSNLISDNLKTFG